MTVEELAGKRYGGEFVFMFGHLEGRTRFVFECFDPRPDHEGKNTYMVSYFEKGLRRRDVVDVPCYMNVSALCDDISKYRISGQLKYYI